MIKTYTLSHCIKRRSEHNRSERRRVEKNPARGISTYAALLHCVASCCVLVFDWSEGVDEFL